MSLSPLITRLAALSAQDVPRPPRIWDIVEARLEEENTQHWLEFLAWLPADSDGRDVFDSE